MFSALKKRLTVRQDDSKVSPFPSGVVAIGQVMQKKFAKGVHYNMKIVIKGDRNTGKSCLLERLQGKPFNEAYIPTQEIQAASINWNYRRGADDVVKVDVWDIVDKGHKKKHTDVLKLSNDGTEENDADGGLALDAELIDVYKGTHGVIMLMDITKPWTWAYIERELPRVPNHIPVLVMANFRDMGEHRLVETDKMVAFVEHIDRPPGSAEVNFAEGSMKNGFGLKYLYKFLNMPFLILQLNLSKNSEHLQNFVRSLKRESLLRQLEANALEIDETRELLLCADESEEQNYEKFMESMTDRKTKTSGIATPSSETDETASEASPNITSSRKEIKTTPSNDISISPLPPSNVRQSAVTTANNRNGRNYKAKVEISPASKIQDQNETPTTSESSKNIDDFNPESDLDPSFLDEKEKKKRWWNRKETKKEPEPEPVAFSNSDEDSDDDGGNPLVMDYQDLDSDDETPTTNTNVMASSTPKTDYDNFDDLSDKEINDNESDSDDGVAQNPLVIAPVDLESSEDEVETKIDIIKTDLEVSETINDKEDHIEIAAEIKEDIGNKVAPSDESSDNDDDDNEAGNRYEVTGDFDLDEPELDDWLGGGSASGKRKKKETKKEEEIVADSSDKTETSTPAFMISADDLDLFVTEQLRKTSISQESEEGEKKKPRKKKEKSKDGERKKKKKPKDRDKTEGEEEAPKKKKTTKSKDGKKKKTASKRTEETEDYELL